MISREVSIPVGETEKVSAVLCLPERHQPGEGTAVILAHGAGNDMNHPLIVTLARGLSEAGHLTLRFNFLYREKGRRAPDPQDTLVLTWQSVFVFLEGDGQYKTEEVVAAGKSMGGRVASQMAADGILPASRLIFLGYPLHPPGRKEKRRDAHLYGIRIPMLFFAGTRDPLCHLASLETVLGGLNAPWHLEIIEGGDHSFRLRKSAGIPQQAVYDLTLQKTTEWLRGPSGIFITPSADSPHLPT